MQDEAILKRLNVAIFAEKNPPQMLDWVLRTPPRTRAEKLLFLLKI